ncbi:MAG: hypothetical protein KAG61_04990 [Bacteriovoracaceae bacterium]|nr:hypothetical protein [Bacteriovoracaceae bacterium]
MKNIILLLVLLYIASGIARAESNCDKINWQDSKVCVIAGGSANMDIAKSMGHARSLALKTARILAYEKLAEKMRGVVIGATSELLNEELSKSQVKTIVRATILNVTFEKEKVSFLADGSAWAEVTLSVPLYGRGGLVPETLKFENGISKTKRTKTGDIYHKYSSLIVNTLGQNFKPGFSVSFMDKQNGTEVFNSNMVKNLKITRGRGPVLYAKSISDAKKLLGTNAVTVQASIGANNTLSLSSEDSVEIRKMERQNGILSDGKIVIVID